MSAELCRNRTKNDLDDALRQLLERKPLEQIRIRELTDLCGIRRQSFYYHFPDVLALFDWSLEQEDARLLARQEACLTWQQAMWDLVNHTARHRCYYRALLESRGRSGLRSVLQETLHSVLDKTLDYYQRRCGDAKDLAANRMFISCWETLFLTLLESWIQRDMLQPPEELICFLEAMVQLGMTDMAWKALLFENK